MQHDLSITTQDHLNELNRVAESLEELKSRMIKLAAEMAMTKNMPSTCHEDWEFTKGMQITNWRKVYDAADKADAQCKDWAVRLRQLADRL